MGHYTEALNLAEVRVVSAVLVRLLTCVCHQKQPSGVQVVGLHHAFCASLDSSSARLWRLLVKACSGHRNGELGRLIDGLEQLSSFLHKYFTAVHVLTPRLRDREWVWTLGLRNFTSFLRCLPVGRCRCLLEIYHVGIKVCLELRGHFKF